MTSIHETKWFPTKSEKNRTYLIRGLGGLEYMQYQALLNPPAPDDEGKIDPKTLRKGQAIIPPEAMEHMLSCGVLDWAGVTEGDGKTPADFDKSRVGEIKYTAMLELWGEISTMSLATADTEKNLSSQSKLSPSQGNSIAGPADGEDIATAETQPRTPSTS